MKKLLFCVVVSQMFIAAFSIKCYECNSATHDACTMLSSKPQLSASYIKECDILIPVGSNITKTFCRKMQLELKYPKEQAQSRTIRSCGWIPSPPSSLSCASQDFEGHHEVKCQCFDNECNGSSQIGIFSIVMLAVLNVLVFIAYN